MDQQKNFLDRFYDCEMDWPIAYNAVWIMLALLSIVEWTLQPLTLALFILVVSIELINTIRYRKAILDGFIEHIESRENLESKRNAVRFGMIVSVASIGLMLWVATSVALSTTFTPAAILPLLIIAARGILIFSIQVKMHSCTTQLIKEFK